MKQTITILTAVLVLAACGPAPTATPLSILTATALPQPTSRSTGTATQTATITNAPTNTPLPPTATRTRTATLTPTTTHGNLLDTTLADFSAGTAGGGIYLANTIDGEVILSPTVEAEFAGTVLPSGWFNTPWISGGSAVVADGAVTLNGSLMKTQAFYGPGRSVEFVATFRARTSQHVGFGNDLLSGPWAIFSTGYPGGTTLKARTLGANSNDTDLGASYLGTPHQYRINWTSASVVYFIDGKQVASHAAAISRNMRLAASDAVGGDLLTVAWMRMSPYSAAGVFVSRVMDAGGAANWQRLTWKGSQPAGTSIGFQARTSADGAAWSEWATVGDDGVLTDPPGRYFQYQASLATTNAMVSPVLEEVAVSY